MSDVDRLHEVIDTLPPRQVYALLTLLDPAQPISNAEFARRLAEAPEEEVDDELRPSERSAPESCCSYFARRFVFEEGRQPIAEGHHPGHCSLRLAVIAHGDREVEVVSEPGDSTGGDGDGANECPS